MNIQEMDILNFLSQESFTNQRDLSECTGFSLGIVNRSLKALEAQGHLDGDKRLTASARAQLRETQPQRAVILAAGIGMRMVPINMETPKGLIRVRGEVLIERLIRQLHAAGVREIAVVVGFMKEQFEYLIDDFGVELVVNENYAGSNNLHSLRLVQDRLRNAYILPCDIYCAQNPFRPQELYSWYMVKDTESQPASLR